MSSPSRKYGVKISFGVDPRSDAQRGEDLSATYFAPPTMIPPVKNDAIYSSII